MLNHVYLIWELFFKLYFYSFQFLSWHIKNKILKKNDYVLLMIMFIKKWIVFSTTNGSVCNNLELKKKSLFWKHFPQTFILEKNEYGSVCSINVKTNRYKFRWILFNIFSMMFLKFSEEKKVKWSANRTIYSSNSNHI